MIVVTGATGALNGTTVDHLLEHVEPSEVAVAVRDRDKAQRFAERGVEVRLGGDYADPDLARVFEGADQLLLVSSNDPGADAVDLHGKAVRAATSAGVGRILYTSHQGAAETSPFVPAVIHHATEQLLDESGIPWTSLRNGFYAHSLAWLLGPWQQTGVVSVPADGPVSWTAREDAAEAAAAILLSQTPYEGPTTLTASAAPTFAEAAQIAAEVAGRPVAFTVVDPEDWVATQVAGGQDERMARFSLGMYQAAAQGLFAGTDPLLRELIGREPQSVGDVLAAQLGS